MKKVIVVSCILSNIASTIALADIKEGYEPKNISPENKAELAISDLPLSQTREGALLWLVENYKVVNSNTKLKNKTLEELAIISENHLNTPTENKLIKTLKEKINER